MGSVMPKKRQIKFYLEPELYERLQKLAQEQGMSAPALVKRVIVGYLGEVGEGDLASRVADLEKKYEQVARELGRFQMDFIRFVKSERNRTVRHKPAVP